MTKRNTMLLVVFAMGGGLLTVALTARSDDVETGVVVADPPEPGSPEAEAERRALAASAGIRVEDLLVRPSHPAGVTPEEFEASLRLRAEAAGPEVARAAEVALRQRLEWAAQYAAGQRRQTARRALGMDPIGVEPAAVETSSIAEPTSCRPFCELLRRCNGTEEPGDWAGCLAACGRGEFGNELQLHNFVALDDCEHL